MLRCLLPLEHHFVVVQVLKRRHGIAQFAKHGHELRAVMHFVQSKLSEEIARRCGDVEAPAVVIGKAQIRDLAIPVALGGKRARGHGPSVLATSAR